MIKRLFFFLVATMSMVNVARAQELNCQIDVIYPQIQGLNVAIFEQMEQDIF